MESGILTILVEGLKAGIFSEPVIFSLMVVVVITTSVYRLIIKPTFSKIQELPTSSEVEIMTTSSSDQIDVIMKRLEKIVKRLDELGVDIEKSNNQKEIDEFRRDLEQIKQILNQFQGHMLYGSGTRLSSDFGNQELR